MNVIEIVKELEKTPNIGFQLSKLKGGVNSTWLLYKKKKFYYYFDISQKIEFIDRYKYTRDELVQELGNSIYTIDQIIS